MIWKPELDELARREAFAREMGGVEKVKRQRDQGRLTVRERIDKMVDADSFHEIGAISGIGEYDDNGELTNLTPANCVFGRGKVAGRPVVVVGDDFTVRGGSGDASISAKPLMAEEMAHDFRLPIVRVIEGSGGGGSVKTIETKGAANLPGGIGGTRWDWYTTATMASGRGRISASRNWAAGRSRPAPAASMMRSTPKRKLSPARDASCPICRHR